jgi:hypothetical protein
MKQIIFAGVLALLLFGFFLEQAFAQVTGTYGTKGTVGANGVVGAGGSTINIKNGTNANGHTRDGTGDSAGEQRDQVNEVWNNS